ncbi:hypothetical protein JST97_02715 [bacterium]|nr:hypothetical protein [bacterium]
MSKERFWLYNWLDKNRILDHLDFASAMGKRETRCALREAAEASRGAPPGPPKDSYNGLFASAGVDPFHPLACAHPVCRNEQINNLLCRVWHYFDHVIIEDELTPWIIHYWDPVCECHKCQAPLEELVDKVAVLLNIKTLGAEELFRFVEKPRVAFLNNDPPQKNLDRLYSSLTELTGRLAPQLFSEGSLESKKAGRKTKVYFDHPDLPRSGIGTFPNKGFEIEVAGREVLQDLLFNLVLDARAANSCGIPIGVGSEWSLYQRWLKTLDLTEAKIQDAPESIAFNLRLPALDNIPIKDLIKLRRNEGDAFIKFRQAIKTAMTERMNQGNCGQKIANEIERDVIEPQLANIRQRLASSQKSLRKKVGVSFGVGSIATIVGALVGHIPFTLAVGAAALSGAVLSNNATINRYVEETRDISLENMYFLWKAQQLHPKVLA